MSTHCKQKRYKILVSYTNQEWHSVLILQHKDSEFICFTINTVSKSSTGTQFILQSQALESANNWHKEITL